MTTNIFADGILSNKVAFVTGGGTGITGGVARALAEAGASVASSSQVEIRAAANPSIPTAARQCRGCRCARSRSSGQGVGHNEERVGKITSCDGAAGNFLGADEASPNVWNCRRLA